MSELTDSEISALLPTKKLRTDELKEGHVIVTEWGLFFVGSVKLTEDNGWSVLDHYENGSVGNKAGRMWDVVQGLNKTAVKSLIKCRRKEFELINES